MRIRRASFRLLREILIIEELINWTSSCPMGSR